MGLGTASERCPGKLHELMDRRATRQWPLMGAFQQAQRSIFIPGMPVAPGTSSMAPLRMVLTFALYSKDSLEQDHLLTSWLAFLRMSFANEIRFTLVGLLSVYKEV